MTSLEKLESINSSKEAIKQALINKGQNPTDEFSTYAQLVENIEVSSDQAIKLFVNNDEMKKDRPDLGTRGLVYGVNKTNLSDGDIFSSCIFPATVTLDTALVNDVFGMFELTEDTDEYFNLRADIRAEYAYFSCFSETMSLDIEYLSSDGKTYTMTGSTEDKVVDFGVNLRNYEGSWDDTLGKFMLINKIILGGLFEYNNYINPDGVKLVNVKSIQYDDSTSSFIIPENPFLEDYLVKSDYISLDKIIKQLNKDYDCHYYSSALSSGVHLYRGTDNNYYIIFQIDVGTNGIDRSLYYFSEAIVYANDKIYLRRNYKPDGDEPIRVCKLDLENATYEVIKEVTTSELTYFEAQDFYCLEFDLLGVGVYVNYNLNQTEITGTGLTNSAPWLYRIPATGEMYDYDMLYSDYDWNAYYTDWELVKTQFTANDYTVSGEYYGQNGVSKGTVSEVKDYIDDPNLEVQKRYKLVSDIMNAVSVSNLTNTYALFYKYDGNLLPDLNEFNWTNIQNAAQMFEMCHSPALNEVKNMDFSSITNGHNLFAGCLQELTNVSNIKLPPESSGALRQLYSANVSNIDTSVVQNMSWTFYYCSKLNGAINYDTANVTNMCYSFGSCKNITSASLNTDNTTDMGSTFAGCSNLTSVTLTNTSKVTNMSSIFSSCSNLLNAPNMDTSNVTNMSAAFILCGKLTSIPNYNMSNVVDTSEMFNSCNNLSAVPNIDLSNVKNSYRMFMTDISIRSLPNLNLCNAEDISYTFYCCRNLSTVNLTTSNKLNKMSRLFYMCYNMTSIPNFETSGVTNMESAFRDIRTITTVPNFNTINVTTMSNLFGGCYNLTTVPNFDTSNVLDMTNMFNSCNNLTTVPNFNTVNVTKMNDMFGSARNHFVNAPSMDTSNVIDTTSMFSACQNLKNIPTYNLSNLIYASYMFRYCLNLVNVPEFYTPKLQYMTNMFGACNNLSNASIQNIVNMCLNSNVIASQRNINNTNTYSPLYKTKFNSSYYANRLEELTAAGWSY